MGNENGLLGFDDDDALFALRTQEWSVLRAGTEVKDRRHLLPVQTSVIRLNDHIPLSSDVQP